MEIGDREFIRDYTQRWFGVVTQMGLTLLEREMVNLFKTPYFEFLIRSATSHFTDLVVVAERIEQAIEIGTVNFKVMMESEMGNGSQIGNLVRLDLTISLATQMSLPKIDIPLPL